MKIACSSTAFDRALRSGELTQLEFLDHAAREIRADGVVLDVRHFPRTDDDYLAQIKKMAADTGLTIAALASDDFFVADEPAMNDQLRMAIAVGAPLLSGRLGQETALTWSAQLEHLGNATSLAKKTNVTLAVRNAAGTFAGSSADCKRVSKESDSAWLRFGLEPAAFDAASDPMLLAEKTVLIWASFEASLREAPQDDKWFGGFVALDRQQGDASVEEAKIAVRTWRTAILQPNRN
jgi:sugar phosphate isomerase/epimerase